MAEIEIFMAYSHRDEDLRRELAEHLSPLERSGLVAVWHDRRIAPGQDWEREIDDHIRHAQIIVPLVSSSFLSSQYCWGVEWRIALERHLAGTAHVVPIIVRACLWNETPMRVLQALPKDAVPVTSWPNRDEAFADVAGGILRVVKRQRSGEFAATETPRSVFRGVGNVGVEGVGRFPTNIEAILRNVKRAVRLNAPVTPPLVLDGVVGPMPDNNEALKLAIAEGLLTNFPVLGLTAKGETFLTALDADDALRQQALNIGRLPNRIDPDAGDRPPGEPVEVVSCVDYGQTGEVRRDWPPIELLNVSPSFASQLSLYRNSGLQALAPKGWKGAGWFGSSGACLVVQPHLPQPFVHYRLEADEFVVVRYFSGNTSGRDGVYQVGAPLFEAARVGLAEFLKHRKDRSEDFRLVPWPGDVLTRHSDLVVEFITPPGSSGTGTLAADASPSRYPIAGIASLAPSLRQAPNVADLIVITVRLSPEREPLVPAILRHFRENRGP